jgi:regulator of chromosome condensation
VVALPGGAKACAVCCGDSHSVALTPDGKVYGWGTFRDKSGVLGALRPRTRARLARSGSR